MLLHEHHHKEAVTTDLMKTNHIRIHFSQCGEDAVLWHYLSERKNGFFVDVGCHHPFRFSNTALLSYFNNWHGINIDMDSRAIEAFKIVRPDDINLNVALGPREERSATIFVDGAVNSLDQASADHQAGFREVLEQKTISVTPLSEVLHQHVPEGVRIDYMNVDVEGWDQLVLESNDWTRFSPEFISVESHGFDLNSPGDNSTFLFLRSLGYRLISHTVVTSIYQKPSA